MTQEEKQLVIKDLCARLPYSPKVKVLHVWNEEKEIEEDIVDTVYCVFPEGYINTGTIDSDIPLNDNIVLYLRPMSSMTDEEDKEWQIYKNNIAESCDVRLEERISELHDWFNRHHFDYRGLIEKGLALEAPKDMYVHEKESV